MYIYKNNTLVFLFFIYGLAFFTMGISAMLQKVPRESSFPLSRSLKHLAFFGLTHGLVEWIIMFILCDLFPGRVNDLLAFATLMVAVSFSFLMCFGLKILELNGDSERFFMTLPWLVFLIWFFAYLYYYNINNQFEDIVRISIFNSLSRYFIGLPGGFIASFALYKNSKYLYKLNLVKISYKFKILSILFALYGILAGLIVKSGEFFPANIINMEMFQEIFGFPVEFARIITVVFITLLFINLIDIFRWEVEQKVHYLSKQKAINDERRKLGRELHDVVIQNLFATGLQIENLIELENDSSKRNTFINIKENLNNTIYEVRKYIAKTGVKQIDADNLNNKITELVNSLKKTYKMKILLNYEINFKYLSSEKCTQLYYIIQEALINALKHSKAKNISVSVFSTVNQAISVIEDNGEGFDSNKIHGDTSYGLSMMEDRVISVNGDLKIQSNSNGTKITVKIPWEDYDNGNLKY